MLGESNNCNEFKLEIIGFRFSVKLLFEDCKRGIHWYAKWKKDKINFKHIQLEDNTQAWNNND